MPPARFSPFGRDEIDRALITQRRQQRLDRLLRPASRSHRRSSARGTHRPGAAHCVRGTFPARTRPARPLEIGGLGHVGRLTARPANAGCITQIGASSSASLTVLVAACLFSTLGVLSRVTYELGLTPYGFVLLARFQQLHPLTDRNPGVAFTLRRGGRLVGWRWLSPRDRLALCVAALAGASLDVTMFLAFERVPVAIVLLYSPVSTNGALGSARCLG